MSFLKFYQILLVVVKLNLNKILLGEQTIREAKRRSRDLMRRQVIRKGKRVAIK